MPIYEFNCQSCRKVSEFILMASDPLPTRCPECGGELRKRISAPAIQFKGSGWYVTDYANRSAASDGGNGSKPKPAEGAEGAASAPAKETTKEPSAPKKDAEPAKKEN